MEISFDNLIESLKLEVCPRSLERIFDEVKQEMSSRGVFFLNPAYIRSLHDKCNSFPKSLDEVLSAAELISEDECLSLYALLVYRVMSDRESFKENLNEIVFPKAIDKATRFLPFMILIPRIDDLYDYLSKKRLPIEIIHATVQQYEECLYIYSERYDNVGLNKHYFDWLQGYVDRKYLNIKRLRFEMSEFVGRVRFFRHNDSGEIKILADDGEFDSRGMIAGSLPVIEGEKYRHAEIIENPGSVSGYEIIDGRLSDSFVCLDGSWSCALKRGDKILKVHIPPNGALTKDIVRESYLRAKQIYSEYFEDFAYDAFVCHSWMLSIELRDILKPTSNIIQFQNDYLHYPIRAKGTDVFNFVFKLKFTTYEDMPEETSLQRAIKQKYLSGERVYECGGAFFACDI